MRSQLSFYGQEYREKRVACQVSLARAPSVWELVLCCSLPDPLKREGIFNMSPDSDSSMKETSQVDQLTRLPQS